MAGWRNSFTEQFCYKEDDDGSEKASASEEIDQGIPNGGNHGMYYQCNHIHILFSFRVLFFFRGELSLSHSTIGGKALGFYGVFTPCETSGRNYLANANRASSSGLLRLCASACCRKRQRRLVGLGLRETPEGT